MQATFEAVRAAVRGQPGVRLLCDSTCAVVPICADEHDSSRLDIYALATLLGKKGWNMFTSQDPEAMAFCVGEQHAGLIDTWAADLKASVEHLREHPDFKPDGDAAVYGTAKSLPNELLDSVVRSYVDVKLSVKPKA